MLRRERDGNVSTMFIPIMGVIVIFVMIVVNYGQWAQVRVGTSNSSDAGCLAGASWLASGVEEAGWIARRMHSTIALTQAIYLVPFCPDQEAYGRDMWTGFTGSGGILDYFHKVINTVLEEAHRLGAVATFTAAFNNLIMRGNAIGVNLAALQQQIYESASPVSQQFAWLSGGNKAHVADFAFDYPSKPAFGTTGFFQPFYVWRRQPDQPDWFPGTAGYDCASGWGYNANGELPAMEGADWSDNPIDVLEGTALGYVKRYEVELLEDQPTTTGLPYRIPTFPDEYYFGACPVLVCGMDEKQLFAAEMPSSIIGGTGTVGVDIGHQVNQNPGGSGGGVLSWPVRFPNTVSGCQAQFGPVPSMASWSWPVGATPVLTDAH